MYQVKARVFGKHHPFTHGSIDFYSFASPNSITILSFRLDCDPASIEASKTIVVYKSSEQEIVT